MKLFRIMLGVIAALAITPNIQAQTAAADTLSTAVGTVLGSYLKESLNNLHNLGADVDADTFVATVAKVLKGQDTGISQDDASVYIDSYIRRSMPQQPVDTLSVESQQKFLAEVAATPGAVTTPSGLVFIVITEGEGQMPTDGDDVSVIYTGRFYDGVEFDHTDSPITFPVSGVTAGFSEGLKMMRPGGIYRIVMPASLGYGQDGIPGAIPGNAALDFTVQLIAIE